MNTDTNAGRKLSVYAAPFSVAGHYNSSLAQLSVQVLPDLQRAFSISTAWVDVDRLELKRCSEMLAPFAQGNAYPILSHHPLPN